MFDEEGYRANVGIILCNNVRQVFWESAYGNPVGSFRKGELSRGKPPNRLCIGNYREETGLLPQHVEILAKTKGWLKYNVPDRWIKRTWRGIYRGQKQIWFLLRLIGSDADIHLDESRKPEFDDWRWTDYWISLDTVIEFKRDVYRRHWKSWRWHYRRWKERNVMNMRWLIAAGVFGIWMTSAAADTIMGVEVPDSYVPPEKEEVKEAALVLPKAPQKGKTDSFLCG